MKNTLKTVMTLTIAMAVLFACQQQKDVSTMLRNVDTRNEIINTIIADHEYVQQLITKMMEDDHTQMMMKGNQEMIGLMLSGSEQMMSIMQNKPEMMSNFMNIVDSDSSMCAQMMTMMKDKPNIMNLMMEMMHKEGMVKKVEGMENKYLNPGHH